MVKRDKTAGPVGPDDIHAYADDALPEARRLMVEAHLEQNPRDAQRMADYRRINEAIARNADRSLASPIPARLISVAQRKRAFADLSVAAMLAWLLIGLGAGWFGRDLIAPDATPLRRLAQDAGAAYSVYALEDLRPVEMPAEQAEELSAWLSSRLGMNVPIPRLSDLGLTFVGGRLLSSGSAPAALLMYETQDRRRVVLYLSNTGEFGGEKGMEYMRANQAGVVFWAQGNAGFGFAGDFSESRMLLGANLIRAQFSA